MATSRLACLSRAPLIVRLTGVRCMSNEFGSGAGKGGGAGGSIRDAGGSFGKMEAAHEEQYFRKLQYEQLKELKHFFKDAIKDQEQQIEMHQQAEQLKRMKEHLGEEIEHHEKSIKQHKESIERHKKRIGQLKHEEDKAKKRE